jgi:hypothetical protein
MVFTFEMNDNFKVADFIDTSVSGTGNTIDQAYLALQPLRYCDLLGRADLFQFRLFYKDNDSWAFAEKQGLPKAVVVPAEAESVAHSPTGKYIGLDKDGREEISFNYQINLLHRASDGDDDFITFPNLFGTKESPLFMAFLGEPQSLFSENIDLSDAAVLADNVEYSLLGNSLNAIELHITKPSGADMSAVKAIVLYQKDNTGGRYAYIAKNVHKLSDADKTQSWWIYPVFNT